MVKNNAKMFINAKYDLFYDNMSLSCHIFRYAHL
jgi:hypothetical protein